MFATFPALPESWLQGLQTLTQWNNLSRTKKAKIQERKLNNVALLKEFLTLRKDSRVIEETSPKELNASLNLSLRFESKTATNTINPALYKNNNSHSKPQQQQHRSESKVKSGMRVEILRRLVECVTS